MLGRSTKNPATQYIYSVGSEYNPFPDRYKTTFRRKSTIWKTIIQIDIATKVTVVSTPKIDGLKFNTEENISFFDTFGP
ncbi:hypothetical protein BH10ACI2_BH10ACI2_07370 [soil metagenome]